jgi:hypothetical protein
LKFWTYKTIWSENIVFQFLEEKNEFLATCWSTHTIFEGENVIILPQNALKASFDILTIDVFQVFC